MKTLQELLDGWENGTLSEADVAELKLLLARSEARRQLAEEFHFYGSVADALKAERTQAIDCAPGEAGQKPIEDSNLSPAWSPQQTFTKALWRLLVHWQWIATAGAALCLLGVCLHLIRSGHSLARLSEITANVLIERAGSAHSARPAERIYAGDVIKTPAGGAATIQWKAQATIMQLEKNTELIILPDNRGSTLSLHAGKLHATVAPQPSGRPMMLHTPQATARVVGTRFTLATTAAATRLEVMEGAVELRKNDSSNRVVIIGAGEFGVAGANVEFRNHAVNGLVTRLTWSNPAGALATNFPGVRGFGRCDYPTNFLAFFMPHPFITNWSEGYREQISGFLTPAKTGFYTFWMVSANASELWLSSDADSAHKRQIASSPPAEDPASLQPSWNWSLKLPASDVYKKRNATRQGPWHKFGSQKSEPQWLVAGNRYYIEVRHEVSDADWMAVLWTRPDEDAVLPSEIVPPEVLSPYFE